MRNIKNGLIMKITGFIAISFSIVCSTAACSDDPVAVANPEPAVTVVKEGLGCEGPRRRCRNSFS